MRIEQAREEESETFRLCLLSAVQTGCVCSVKAVCEPEHLREVQSRYAAANLPC